MIVELKSPSRPITNVSPLNVRDKYEYWSRKKLVYQDETSNQYHHPILAEQLFNKINALFCVD